jgi:transposase-like protein
MDAISAKRRDAAAAQRGRIIQRILVDGWSPAQAAAAFGVTERQVARWLAAYRRRGMASLRGRAAARGARGSWMARLGGAALRIFSGLRGTAGQTAAAPCVELHRRDAEFRHRR